VTILTIRTDKPEAEVGLYENGKQLSYISWTADRQLSSTLNSKLQTILDESSKSLSDINGIVIFRGPGSFTGLRIGFSVANALAYSFNKPIVAIGGEVWIEEGLKAIAAGQNDKIALPEYGAPANITQPKK
jgi:tRNA threonylcarbamoyladenosine biosynthesis protein TsaB